LRVSYSRKWAKGVTQEVVLHTPGRERRVERKKKDREEGRGRGALTGGPIMLRAESEGMEVRRCLDVSEGVAVSEVRKKRCKKKN